MPEDIIALDNELTKLDLYINVINTLLEQIDMDDDNNDDDNDDEDDILNLLNFPDLQTAVKDKEKHTIALNAYKKRVKELQNWLDEMKIRQSSTPLPTDSVESLRHNLHENQVINQIKIS